MLFFGVVMLTACHTQISIPEAVKEEFNSKYSMAKDEEWETENDEYEVEFEMNGIEMSATYDSKGTWKETESEMEKDDLPTNIKAALAKKYAGYEIEEAEMIETSEMKGYEIELEKDDEEIEVVYTLDGVFVKEEIKKDDADDEN